MIPTTKAGRAWTTPLVGEVMVAMRVVTEQGESVPSGWTLVELDEPLDVLLADAYSRGLNDALRQMPVRPHTLDLDSPEAVERLARALHASYERDPAAPRIYYADLSDSERGMWRHHAKAILAALREQHTPADPLDEADPLDDPAVWGPYNTAGGHEHWDEP